ncbi:hypothetical protein IV203_007283 [Nitzschia inconspicua]|uniref:Uncharacterized protein n=1 Tax=Nitzschia inconspicua TaxID=303405 RepID=A0A9K3PD17_9STRA|nr:hypothetical protein IV203_007283 [Nitzschia inconspicua]
MTDNIKFHGPLMKELQRCAAFRAYEHIMSSGTTVAGSDLEEAHLNLYFSDVDEDHVGFAEQLVKGTGMFNALYNEIDGELVMKELYHCLPGKKFYSNASNTQGAINMAVMSSKNLSNRVKLKKRVIVTMAKETLKFGKKALAIVKRSDYYRTYMATSSFPSGKNYEDYCHFVREEMFKASESGASLRRSGAEGASVRSESGASLRRSGAEGASVRSESVTYEMHDTPSTARKETDDGDDSSIGGSDDLASEASDASIESTMEETQRTMELKRKNPDISTERIGVPPTLLLRKNEHNKKRKQRKP